MHVLVVEDERRMAALLTRGLSEEGYAVDVAYDGVDGLWQASEHNYDAIVLDAMLPGLDGLEVCRTLRSRGRWMPVIMLTARVSIGDRVEGLDAGADDYLAKPFSFAELAARLRALIRRQPVERPTVLTVGSVELDPAAHTVTAFGSPIELTSKEFALLELLMRNPGLALSRTRILEHVWDFAFEPSSNVVDQYAGYLRRKLAGRPGTPLITTVRGVGYRLDAP